MDKTRAQKESFEKRSKSYNDGKQAKNSLLYFDLMWQNFLKHTPHPPHTQIAVCEPMSGTGSGYSVIRKYITSNFTYEAFDYSDTLVKIAKHRYPDMNIRVLDINAWDEHEKYDVIIIIGGLHHVAHTVETVLPRIYKALKLNGYFISLEPTYNNFIYKKITDKIYEKSNVFDENTERRFSLKELTTLYLKSGFEVVKQSYPGLISYILFANPQFFSLNIAKETAVRLFFGFDEKFFNNIVGKKLSFCTITLLQKQYITSTKELFCETSNG